MIKTYDQTSSVKGLPPVRKDKQKNDFYVNGIYKCKPLNFSAYAKCKVLNVMKRTVVVEILETYNDHDKHLAIELQGRTVTLNKHVGKAIEIGADAYKKSFGEETRVELKNTNSPGLERVPIIMVDLKGKTKQFNSIRDVCRETGLPTSTISKSAKTKQRLKRGNMVGYQFFFANIDKNEMNQIIQENLKAPIKIFRKRKPVFVEFPDGTVKRFESAYQAAKEMQVDVSFFFNCIARGKPVSRGRNKGVRVYREEE